MEGRPTRKRSDGRGDLAGRLFAIIWEKNAEDGVAPHLRKCKARKCKTSLEAASRRRRGRWHTSYSKNSAKPRRRWVLSARLLLLLRSAGIIRKCGMPHRRIQARIDGPDRPGT